MPFEGDLKLVSLESVLRNIDSNALTGILSVRDARGERKVAFISGKIHAFLPLPAEARGVPRALSKRTPLTVDEIEKLRTSLAWKRMNLKRALEYRGLVKEEDYARAVRDEVIVPHMQELFLHRERTFRFDEAAFEQTPAVWDAWDPDQLAAELRVAIEPLVFECLKRVDEKSPITTTFEAAKLEDDGPQLATDQPAAPSEPPTSVPENKVPSKEGVESSTGPVEK
ncbi:MAG TPA: DUF4388 domain-containing protein [Planctomycetota bacterium]|nr:DUF4388 domain-containing protein [Planctomycetota bacterium]